MTEKRAAAAPRKRRSSRSPKRITGTDGSYAERFVPMPDGCELWVRTWHEDSATGDPLLLTDGLGCEGYAWKYIIDSFQNERPIIHWQYRGHGRSQGPARLEELTVATAVADLEEVLDAVGAKRVIPFGHSMGVQVALEAYRHISERIAGLVLFCGSYEHPIESFHGAQRPGGRRPLGNRIMRRAFPLVTDAFVRGPSLVHALWEQIVPTRLAYEFAVHTEVNGRRIAFEDFWPYMEHLGRMDMRVFASFASSLATHSAADLLEDIQVPTLIISGGKDTFTPAWRSAHMHQKIPQSEYLFIPDGTHTAPIEHPDLIGLRVEKFLRERLPAPARRRRRKTAQKT